MVSQSWKGSKNHKNKFQLEINFKLSIKHSKLFSLYKTDYTMLLQTTFNTTPFSITPWLLSSSAKEKFCGNVRTGL